VAARNNTKRQRHGIDDACTYGNGSLRDLDFLLWTMGRNMSEGGGLMSGAAEDDGNGRSMSEAAEDDG